MVREVAMSASAAAGVIVRGSARDAVAASGGRGRGCRLHRQWRPSKCHGLLRCALWRKRGHEERPQQARGSRPALSRSPQIHLGHRECGPKKPVARARSSIGEGKTPREKGTADRPWLWRSRRRNRVQAYRERLCRRRVPRAPACSARPRSPPAIESSRGSVCKKFVSL